jgi:exosortase/archaeosortase family protein
MTLPLLLLGTIASAQLTLYWRSGGRLETVALMASLCWLGGGLLLADAGDPTAGRRRAWLLGLPGLIWSLLVLTNTAHLYDPLLHLLPLVVLPSIGLIGGVPLRSRSMVDLVAMGLLLPLQLLLNQLLPRLPLARTTAELSAFLVWLGGGSALAEGTAVQLPGRTLVVGASCTGSETLSLCLAGLVMLALLFPLPCLQRQRGSGLMLLGVFSLGAAFVLNGLRVAVLALTPAEDFVFWHDGGGAHLFAMASLAQLVAAYLILTEWSLRQS